MGERSWTWPAATLAFGAWTILVAMAAHGAGRDAAEREATERQAYATRKMVDIGFCGWLEATDFANECARRARRSPEEGE